MILPKLLKMWEHARENRETSASSRSCGVIMERGIGAELQWERCKKFSLLLSSNIQNCTPNYSISAWAGRGRASSIGRVLYPQGPTNRKDD